MKLLGKDISTANILSHVEARLRARGLSQAVASPIDLSGVEPRVDPAAFYLESLAEHADTSRALPLETHRTGMGRAVLLAKWTFRRTCQVFINETLGRQRLFNGHVRDAYAQLSAEVNSLRAEVESLRGGATAQEAEPPPPPLTPPPAAKKKSTSVRKRR